MFFSYMMIYNNLGFRSSLLSELFNLSKSIKPKYENKWNWSVFWFQISARAELLFALFQQIRGQNFAIFWIPLRVQKQTFFDLIPPHLVNIVIEWPLILNSAGGNFTNQLTILTKILILISNLFIFSGQEWSVPSSRHDARVLIPNWGYERQLLRPA